MPDLSEHNGVLGKRLAAHLLRRATFGPNKAAIDAFAALTPATAVDQLATFSAITNKPIDPVSGATWVDVTSFTAGSDDVEKRHYVMSWMLDNFRTDSTLRSKMMLFLHQNWIVDEESWNSQDLYDHVKLLEYYSLGSYKQLALKMSMDNRMLVYLTGFQNTGSNPNQNYAREFLELFTIGKGPQIAPGNYTNYTENDVQAAALIFGGYYYNIDNNNKDATTNIRRCGRNQWNHSAQTKVFSAAFQNTSIPGAQTIASMENELNLFVNMVFNQIETAKNICRKLYRFFVGRSITAAVETDIIVPLANTLKNNDYNLSVVVKQLLKSKHFYDLDDANAADNRIGGMVKSPLDLLLGTLRYFSISPFLLPSTTTPGTTTAASALSVWRDFYWYAFKNDFLENSQMRLFNSVTVAGYAPYYSAPNYDRNWFATNSITQRYYLGKCLLENKRWPYNSWAQFGARIDFVWWVRNNISDPKEGNIIVQELLESLFPEQTPPARLTYFLNQTLLGTLSLINWRNEWNAYIASGNSNVVKPRLELLFRTILYSHEYQLQ
jgi:uncharacterized protein (DUF1800 family)